MLILRLRQAPHIRPGSPGVSVIIQMLLETFSGHFANAERLQEGVGQLAVDHPKALTEQGLAQADKSQFGCIRLFMEHGFTAENRTNLNAIETTDQRL